MKITTTLKQASVIASAIALTSTVAIAHPSHDHRHLPYKWNFTQQAQSKIEQKLASNSIKPVIGLSMLDQKIFRDYGVLIGNIFKASLNGQMLVIKRISLGIVLLDANQLTLSSSLREVPVMNKNWVTKISMPSHPGHDHQILKKEWTFSSKTARKIENRVEHGNYPVSVGLSSHELKVMDAYGIKIGNSFKTHVAGQDLNVTRMSGGLMIEAGNLEVASLSSIESM